MSESYKIVFPTMLRKMWSGGEVQKFIDDLPDLYTENQLKEIRRKAIQRCSHEFIQLCKDFSSLTGNVYIKDVESAVAELLEQLQDVSLPESSNKTNDQDGVIAPQEKE